MPFYQRGNMMPRKEKRSNNKENKYLSNDSTNNKGVLPLTDHAPYDDFEIPIDKIELGDHQPRSREGIQARGSLTALKESIKSVGLLQPILVQQQDDGKYLLISGERRYQACKALGRTKIRAVLPSSQTQKVLETQNRTLDELALFENLERKNLTPIEEGRCFSKLLYLLEVTQSDLAKRLNLKDAYISERISLLYLPDEVQLMIEEGKISISQARELSRLSDLPDGEREETQTHLAKKMIVEKITVRKAKKLVDDLLGKNTRDSSHLTRLGAKKALFYITTLDEKFDEIELNDLSGEEELDKLVELSERVPTLIKKLQSMKRKLATMVKAKE